MNHQIRSGDHCFFSDSGPPGSDSRPGQAGPNAGGSDGGGLGGGGSHSTSGGVTFYATQSGLSVSHAPGVHHKYESQVFILGCTPFKLDKQDVAG